MSKATILIVEDKNEFRTIYGDRLRFGGYDVKEAQDGNEALELLKGGGIDLIVTDLNMPNKDGYALIADVRANETLKDIPILVMSVFDTGEHLKKAMDAGANDYIVKGTQTPNAVAERVDALIAKRTAT